MPARRYAIIDAGGKQAAEVTLDIAKLIDIGAAEPVIEREIISLPKGHIARIISNGRVIYEVGPFEDRDDLVKALDAQEAKASAAAGTVSETVAAKP
jgi:hypothetical protein